MINIISSNSDIVDLFVPTIDENQPDSSVVYNARLSVHAETLPLVVQDDSNNHFQMIQTALTSASDATKTDVQTHPGSADDVQFLPGEERAR